MIYLEIVETIGRIEEITDKLGDLNLKNDNPINNKIRESLELEGWALIDRLNQLEKLAESSCLDFQDYSTNH